MKDQTQRAGPSGPARSLVCQAFPGPMTGAGPASAASRGSSETRPVATRSPARGRAVPSLACRSRRPACPPGRRQFLVVRIRSSSIDTETGSRGSRPSTIPSRATKAATVS